jgi:hypothetical protein
VNSGLYVGIVALVVGALAMQLDHRRKMRKLHLAEGLNAGWAKTGADRWRCPHCGCDVTGWPGRKLHAADTSPCADLWKQRVALENAAVRQRAAPDVHWSARQVDRAGVDTLTEQEDE